MSLRAMEMPGGIIGMGRARNHWASRISPGSITISPLAQSAVNPSMSECGNGHGWLAT